MRRLAVTVAAALALAGGASTAGAVDHPGAYHVVTLDKRVCGTPVTMTAPQLMPAHGTVSLDGYVNGKRMYAGVASGGLYLFGSFTVVQAARTGTHIAARAVRTIPRCAHVRLIWRWRS